MSWIQPRPRPNVWDEALEFSLQFLGIEKASCVIAAGFLILSVVITTNVSIPLDKARCLDLWWVLIRHVVPPANSHR